MLFYKYLGKRKGKRKRKREKGRAIEKGAIV